MSKKKEPKVCPGCHNQVNWLKPHYAVCVALAKEDDLGFKKKTGLDRHPKNFHADAPTGKIRCANCQAYDKRQFYLKTYSLQSKIQQQEDESDSESSIESSGEEAYIEYIPSESEEGPPTKRIKMNEVTELEIIIKVNKKPVQKITYNL